MSPADVEGNPVPVKASAGAGAAGPGTVYLVGAGPGDPGLMTRRSLELIAAADTILYDRLIPSSALADARGDAELRYVGKQASNPSLSQEEINGLLVERGRAGRAVVRLKGGDPFVFGRGGEEAQALRAAGIPFEVVPGVTAGVAAPAYAGIPVTHREHASAVAFVTAHEDPEKDGSALDWSALAKFPGTLVLYMGVSGLSRVAERLIGGGRPAGEPVAVVERGTLPRQRTLLGSLADIGERVTAAGVEPPAITIVGPAARLHEDLAWLERRPLFGKSVVVTRARTQASELASRLSALGADVVEAPVIRIEPRSAEGAITAAIERLGEYALICVTSSNAAALLLGALARVGGDARALTGATIAAIGASTAEELCRHGVRADVVPKRAISEALVEALEDTPVEGRRVLVAAAAGGRDLLPEALRARGAQVDVVPLYDTVAEPLPPALLDVARRADYVTFTSSSTVRFFLDALGASGETNQAGADPILEARVISIGPATSETARQHGLEVDLEADRHDSEGIVAVLVADASAG